MIEPLEIVTSPNFEPVAPSTVEVKVPLTAVKSLVITLFESIFIASLVLTIEPFEIVTSPKLEPEPPLIIPVVSIVLSEKSIALSLDVMVFSIISILANDADPPIDKSKLPVIDVPDIVPNVELPAERVPLVIMLLLSISIVPESDIIDPVAIVIFPNFEPVAP